MCIRETSFEAADLLVKRKAGDGGISEGYSELRR
jgi:hypothetical protein